MLSVSVSWGALWGWGWAGVGGRAGVQAGGQVTGWAALRAWLSGPGGGGADPPPTPPPWLPRPPRCWRLQSLRRVRVRVWVRVRFFLDGWRGGGARWPHFCCHTRSRCIAIKGGSTGGCGVGWGGGVRRGGRLAASRGRAHGAAGDKAPIWLKHHDKRKCGILMQDPLGA